MHTKKFTSHVCFTMLFKASSTTSWEEMFFLKIWYAVFDTSQQTSLMVDPYRPKICQVMSMVPRWGGDETQFFFSGHGLM